MSYPVTTELMVLFRKTEYNITKIIQNLTKLLSYFFFITQFDIGRKIICSKAIFWGKRE